MKRITPLIVLGLAMLTLFPGCETIDTATAATPAKRTSATLQGPKEKVWPLLVSEIGLEYPVRAIEKDSGLITTDWVNLPAGFNNMSAAKWTMPRSGFMATWNGLRMNMKIMAVEAEPGKTQVSVNCHYEAFEDNVQHAWVVQDTNGSLENSILTRIEAKLPAALAAAEKAPAVVPTQSQQSPTQALVELKKLLDAGVITQTEYDAKKAELLKRL